MIARIKTTFTSASQPDGAGRNRNLGRRYPRAVPKGDSLFLRINQFAIDTPWLHTPA